MAAQEGISRLNRLSVYLAYCGLAGLALWLIVFSTFGQWGLGELIFLTVAPLLSALSTRVIAWLLAGFFETEVARQIQRTFTTPPRAESDHDYIG
jgi:hypothetical protein